MNDVGVFHHYLGDALEHDRSKFKYGRKVSYRESGVRILLH